MAGLSGHYQIILTRDDRLDQMEVLVEAMTDDMAADLKAKTAAELAHHIKAIIGSTAKVTVLNPGGVERSAGKARRVIDKRPKG